MKIIITGGGTGGHIYPGISLAQEFLRRDKDNKIIFVGAEQKMESEIVPREGFQFFSLRVRGFERKICLANLHSLWLFLSSLSTSFRIIKKFKPDLVLGTGGYVSGSVTLVSSLTGIPTFIHEQNLIPGITNQFLSLVARKVFISFPESNRYFWRKGRIVFKGNPVRENIWQGNREHLIEKTGLNPNKKTILVFGGSKGASAINQVLLDCLKLLDKSLWLKWQVLIISGKEDFNNLKERITHLEYQEGIRIIDYLYQIGDAYDLAEIVVCRAGATTVAEITAKGLPSILIPYPYATGDHQLYNARFLENSKAALVIKEEELTSEKLAEVLTRVINDREKLKTMARNSKKIGNRKAAREIVDEIYNSIEGKKLSPK